MKPADDRTLVPGMLSDNGDMDYNDGTMIAHSASGTLVPGAGGNVGTLESSLGTMVINSDGEDDDSTMKRMFVGPHSCQQVPIEVKMFMVVHFSRSRS